jgi:hypothetical protein
MNRRKFFAFLPAAPFAAIAAAEAMAKAPPASMAPDKALMTLAAHKPPPPPPVSINGLFIWVILALGMGYFFTIIKQNQKKRP